MKTHDRKSILLLFASYFGIGGIQRYNQSLVKSLKKLAYPHQILALNDTERDSFIPTFSKNKFRFILYSIKESYKSGIIIVGHVNLLPVLFFLSNKKKRILIIHGIDAWKPLKWIEKKALRKVDEVWSVSHFTKKEFLKFNPDYSRSIEIIPNQLPANFEVIPFTEMIEKHNQSKLILLTVTRLVKGDEKRKHVLDIFPALKKLAEQGFDFEWHIVTSGNDVEYHRNEITADPIMNHLTHFHLAIGDDELKTLYRKSHWFILPSEKEGFGIVFLEAMANGCIVIGGNAGGTPDVINHNENGFLVDFSSSVKLSDQLYEIIKTVTTQSKQHELLKQGMNKLYHFLSDTVTIKIENVLNTQL